METPQGRLWLDSSISRNHLKSVIARVTRRREKDSWEYKITGAAWGGPASIARVEVQIDDGTWKSASIDQRAGDQRAGAAAWVLWSIQWQDAAPGEHTLVSRAIDTRGEIQPTLEELQAKLVSNREDNSQWPRRMLIGPVR